MKKRLLAFCCAVTSMAFFAGCGAEEPETPTHTHTWATDWSKGETGHWHACTDATCEETSDFAAHTPNADDGDCTTAITCSVCGYETTAAAAEHAWNEGVETKAPTTSSVGEKTFTCETCGTTKTEDIPELEGFAVSFDTNGGGEIATQAVKENEKATEPTDPNKEGAIFKGWTKDGAPFDFNTPITADTVLTAAYDTWTVAEYLPSGSTGVVSLDGEVDDAEAYGGKAYKATLTGAAVDTKGIKLTFGGDDGIDISGYAHVFIRLKIVNPVNVTNCTLRIGVNGEPVAGTQGYPYFDPVAAQSSDVWRHYVSYDIKDMTDATTLKTLYIARTSQAITAGEGAQIEISIDHVDFVEEALKLDNVTSYKSNVSGNTYTVKSGADSQKEIIQTSANNNDRARFLGWDFDIYTGEYVFVGNFRQETEGGVSDWHYRALTLNFDNIDVTQYEHIYVKLKNYNSDPATPANCTISLKVNDADWQNVPTADWTPADVTSGAMYTGYFEYDICSIADLTTLSSFTMYRLGAVNGYNYGIMMYIESITFVPKAA